VGDSGQLHVKKTTHKTNKTRTKCEEVGELYFERGVCVCCGGEHIIEKTKQISFQFRSPYVTKEKYLKNILLCWHHHLPPLMQILVFSL
jgi:hypothetical protein